jgi:peroxiredoxin Q/BCP
MLSIGHRAPEFTLPSSSGGEISLTTLLNRGPLLLCFLPSRLLPGAVRGLAALEPALREAGLQIACVSQRPVGHSRLRPLAGPMLSDVGKAVIHMYEVAGPAGLGVRRASYLIDPGRIIRGAARSTYRTSPHVRLVRRSRELLTSAIANHMR